MSSRDTHAALTDALSDPNSGSVKDLAVQLLADLEDEGGNAYNLPKIEVPDRLAVQRIGALFVRLNQKLR